MPLNHFQWLLIEQIVGEAKEKQHRNPDGRREIQAEKSFKGELWSFRCNWKQNDNCHVRFKNPYVFFWIFFLAFVYFIWKRASNNNKRKVRQADRQLAWHFIIKVVDGFMASTFSFHSHSVIFAGDNSPGICHLWKNTIIKKDADLRFTPLCVFERSFISFYFIRQFFLNTTMKRGFKVRIANSGKKQKKKVVS